MDETSKSRPRRAAEGFGRYLRGAILDIGAGTDPITTEAKVYDKADGDAQKLEGIPNESYDTVYSSHCLEHMRDPIEALLNWWRVLKPGGYLIVAVPDEDLYEQGIWPSAFNGEHAATFTAGKFQSWSPASRNIIDLIPLLQDHKLISLRTIDDSYDYALTGGDVPVDQTLTGAEAQIEVIVQKMDRQFALRSQLPNMLTCTCGSLFTAYGVTVAGDIRGRCNGCGQIGDITIKVKES